MKTIRYAGVLAAVLAVSLCCQSVARAFTDEAVKVAEELLAIIKDKYNVGEVTTVDIAIVEFHLIDMRWNAKQITRAVYCEQGIPILRILASGTRKNHTVGQASMEDVLASQRRLYEFVASCRPQ